MGNLSIMLHKPIKKEKINKFNNLMLKYVYLYNGK